MRISRLFLWTLLIAVISVAAGKVSPLLFAAQESGAAASDETAPLKGFAEIQPIDAHVHQESAAAAMSKHAL